MTSEAVTARIGALQPHELPLAARTLATALADNSVGRWLHPDPLICQDLGAAFFVSLLATASTCGHLQAAWIGEHIVGGAVRTPRVVPAVLDIDLSAFDVGAVRPLKKLARIADERQPWLPVLHRRLAFVGVLPAWRRRGIASYLLTGPVSAAGRGGLGTSVVAVGPEGRELFREHGFSEAGAPSALPEGTALFPMWLPPDRRPTGAAAPGP